MTTTTTRDTMAEVADLVANGMDPTLTEQQRLDALNAALRISPTTALAMATSFGQHLVSVLADLGHHEANTMAVIRARVANFAHR